MVTSVNAFPQPLPASPEEEDFLHSPRLRRRDWRRKPGFHKVFYGPPCHDGLAWPTQSYEKCGNNKAKSEKNSVYHCILSVAWQTQAEHHASIRLEGRIHFAKWAAGCNYPLIFGKRQYFRVTQKLLCRSWQSSLQKYYRLSGAELNLFLGGLEQAPFSRATQPTAERSCSICWKSFRRRTKLRVRYLSSTTGLTLSS